MNAIVIKIIRFYQIFLRNIFKNLTPLFVMPVACRHYPTCSDYTLDAFRKHNFLKASELSLLRFFKCNPFNDTTL